MGRVERWSRSARPGTARPGWRPRRLPSRLPCPRPPPRPRDAAAIFDDLELPVLIEILDRMGERKAAPVIGAMRPDKARTLTAELARHRARRSSAD